MMAEVSSSASPVSPAAQQPVTWALDTPAGSRLMSGAGTPVFTVVSENVERFTRLRRGGVYRLATTYVNGEFEVRGDLIAATRTFSAEGGSSAVLTALLALARCFRLEHLFQSRTRAAQNVRYHYDQKTDFYRQFLDSRLVYSCAYFRHPDITLDEAQRAKLDHICRKLDVQDGCRFLDLGCGWGGLVLYAAENYGAAAAGCTLSRQQLEYATSLVHRRGLDGRVQVFERDYRDLRGRYDRVASIGMFEHVGRRRLRAYLEKVYSLLACDGLFLNHGIMRPQTISENPASVFWRRNVFPGAELVHLSDVVREAERVGFELLDVENLRRHYALTCRAWVANLQRNRNECLRFVDPRTYRSWLLLLAGSVVSFEDGTTHVSQVLLAKHRKTEATRLTRDYMYAARS